MKLLKWFFGLIIAMAVLIAVVVVTLNLVVDEDMVKGKFSSQFASKTGQSLDINGPLQWSIFPWVGIKLSEVRVGSAPGFDEKPLATVQELDVKVGIKPLFEKKIVVDTVVLKGVRL
ncbi:MAG TPA: AsmA family protein, partial [Thiolapillus brandeum]|nr:AsmA family protein [Thiolapillus brandeum]